VTVINRPPSIPSWLLRTFGAGPTVDALLGDLSEEYQRGHSAAWFWRQALAAVPLSLAEELRAHPVIAVRAAGLGWVLVSAMRYGLRGARRYVEAAIDVYAPAHEQYLAPAYRFVDGARIWETVPMEWNRLVYYPAAGLVLQTLIGLASGWLVARLHRRHRGVAVASLVAAMVLVSAYAASVVSSTPRPQPPFDIVFIVAWFAQPWARAISTAGPIVAMAIGGFIAGSAREYPRHAANA
jgi:hypothetical protein